MPSGIVVVSIPPWFDFAPRSASTRCRVARPEVSIPPWFDFALSRMQKGYTLTHIIKVSIPPWFDFAIAAMGWPLSGCTKHQVSIPPWFDFAA
jgi:hypothetical protein